MVNYKEMVDYKLFSADSHVSEPPDLWVERLDSEYQFRAPRVESKMKDGKLEDFMFYEGFPPHPVSVGVASAARLGSPVSIQTLARQSSARRCWRCRRSRCRFTHSPSSPSR